jgi:diguanylate cyclase (GGDEF)-like protein/PAS domain S-box-containing protein
MGKLNLGSITIFLVVLIPSSMGWIGKKEQLDRQARSPRNTPMSIFIDLGVAVIFTDGFSYLHTISSNTTSQIILETLGYLLGVLVLFKVLRQGLALVPVLRRSKVVPSWLAEELKRLFKEEALEWQERSRQLQQEVEVCHSSKGKLNDLFCLLGEFPPLEGEAIYINEVEGQVVGLDSLEAAVTNGQIELTLEKSAQTELLESEQWLRAMAEATPIPLVISRVDDGTILCANSQLGLTFGLPGEELIGRQTPDFYYNPTDRQVLLDRLSSEGDVHNHEVRVKKADGTPFWVTLSVRSVRFNGEPALLSVFSDITERKQTEEALKARASQQAAVAQLGQQALAGTELVRLMNEAVTLVAQILGVEYCGVWELLPGDKALLLRAGVGWQEELVGYALVGAQASSQIGYTLLTREPVIVEDLRLETRFSGPPLLHNYRVVSGLSVIIPSQKTPFGVLGAYTRRHRTFIEDDLHFLQAIAHVLATALERHQSEGRLHLMERAIASSSNGIVITDCHQLDDPIIYVNPAFESMTGYAADELIGRNCRFLQGPDTEQPALDELRAAIREQRECHVILQNYRRDGTRFWNELYISPVVDAQECLTHFVGILTDITKRKRAQEALRQSEERFRTIFENAGIGIVVIDADAQLVQTNSAVQTLLGYSARELTRLNYTSVTHPDDWKTEMPLFQQCLQGSTQGYALEKRFLRKDGRVIWGKLTISSIQEIQEADRQLQLVVGMVEDITERKRMEEQLLHDAFHESLTGLPNRALFMERLRQALARTTQDKNYLFAVLFLDLDRFKVVNDSLGHMVGDRLLVAIARRLEASLRSTDTVARLGGDEFAILLDEIERVNDAIAVAEHIQQALKLPFNLNGYEVFTTTSIGIALSATGYERPEDILRDADTAMYRAKEQGRVCHAVFDTAMYERAVTLLQLETDLRWVLERQELRVCYQPIVSLVTDRLVGFEALVRWMHPERGLISPAEFIPVAEETGLIMPIGEWVLRESCRQVYQWQEQLPVALPLTISVNLSGKQFSQPDLIEQIDQILQETGLKPDCLKLEITESELMQNATAVATLLEQLKALKIQLSIDDFGTGYSSLSRLRQFPINTLKIDRSFISTMSDNGENAEIVQAIITLAHNLGMDVVAEGVETAEQLAYLKTLRCEYGQGYFFSKPLNGEAAGLLLAMPPQW